MHLMQYIFNIIIFTLLLFSNGYAQITAPIMPPPPPPLPLPIISAGAILKNCSAPVYPQKQSTLGVEGITTVEMVIAEEGVVSSARVAKTSGSVELDNAALEAARTCLFNPGIQNGVPVKQTARRDYHWKIDKQPIQNFGGGIYRTSEKNSELITASNLPKFSIDKVENMEKNIPTCRMGSKALISVPPEKYLEFAFNEELRNAKKYEKGINLIDGKIVNLTYSTYPTGFWDITIELISKNGVKIVKTSKIDFAVSYQAAFACKNAEDAFLTLVQKVIGEFVSDKDFSKMLVSSSNELSVANSTLPLNLVCPSQVSPQFPQRAADDGLSGKVRAQIKVSNSSVQDIEILSGPRVFHASVKSAIMQYKCLPTEGIVTFIQDYDFDNPKKEVK